MDADMNLNIIHSFDITCGRHRLLASEHRLMVVDTDAKTTVVKQAYPVSPLEAIALIKAYLADAAEVDRQKLFSLITTDERHCGKFGDPDCICAPARLRALGQFEALTSAGPPDGIRDGGEGRSRAE